MNAKDLLDQGQLSAAITQLQTELKSAPSDADRRTFLFELLAFAGDWDRAVKQLDTLGHLDSAGAGAVGISVYRYLIEGERKRTALFRDGQRPRFLLDPPPDVALRLDALEALRTGRTEEASALVDRAEEARPARAGSFDGTPFDDIRDADDLLAGVLEVHAPAGYFWVPWEHVQFVEVQKPTKLRDLIWASARLATHDGQMGEVYLPNLYPGSAADPDEGFRLGRKTDWREAAPGVIRGVGHKVLLVGEDPRTLHELTSIEFPIPPSPEE